MPVYKTKGMAGLTSVPPEPETPKVDRLKRRVCELFEATHGLESGDASVDLGTEDICRKIARVSARPGGPWVEESAYDSETKAAEALLVVVEEEARKRYGRLMYAFGECPDD